MGKPDPIEVDIRIETQKRLPPPKLRACLGIECKETIESRYPGLCPKCKSGLGNAWASPAPEYADHSSRGIGIPAKDGRRT